MKLKDQLSGIYQETEGEIKEAKEPNKKNSSNSLLRHMLVNASKSIDKSALPKPKVPKLSGPMFNKKGEPGFLRLARKNSSVFPPPDAPHPNSKRAENSKHDQSSKRGGSNSNRPPTHPTNRSNSLLENPNPKLLNNFIESSSIVPTYSQKPKKTIPR